MLPQHRNELSDALPIIKAQIGRGTDVRLRIGVQDRTVVEGILVSATSHHLAVRTKAGQIVNVKAEHIRSLALAQVRRGREWALAGVGIVGAVSGIIGLTALPFVGDYLRLHSQFAFQVVFYTAIGALVLLLATTSLRGWLTRWEQLLTDPER